MTKTRQSKKRILIWGDSPNVPTGFGIVSKNLFADLPKKYTVAFLGINEHGLKYYDTSQWFIYPIDNADPFGYKKMPLVLKNFEPDLVILFQDIFNVENAVKIIRQHNIGLPIVTYFPVDGHPYNKAWANIFQKGKVKESDKIFDMTQEIITYTNWAADEIRASLPAVGSREIHVLPHGVDFKSFYPLAEEEVELLRAKNGWDDKFMIINNNRFQPRKQMLLTLYAASMLYYGYNKCSCGFYYPINEHKCSLNGCGPDEIVDVVPGNFDIGLYIHAANHEMMMGPPPGCLLQAAAANAGWMQPEVGKNLMLRKESPYSKPLTEAELNELYNMADINLTTAIGEGFGFSLAEASATATTTVAPKNSVMREILGPPGAFVDNAGIFSMAMDNGHARPVVSMPRLMDVLTEHYEAWVANGRKKVRNQPALDRMKEHFDWQDKRDKLGTIVRKYI